MIKDLRIWGGPPIYRRLIDAIHEQKYTTINVLGPEEHNIELCWREKPEFKETAEFAKKYSLNINLGCFDSQLFYSRGDACPSANYSFWPTFWFFETARHMLDRAAIDNNFHEIKFPFVSLNKNGHQHRSLLIDLLAKHDLIDKGAISWHDFSQYGKQYTWKYWSPHKKILDEKTDIDNVDLFRMPQEYYSSFCDLVSESTFEVHFITEKTVKPILLQKPFLVSGPPGFYTVLDELGFQKYDEIFDYSFDTVVDDEKRTELVVENIKRLQKIKLPKALRKLRPKLIYNQQLALRIAQDPKLIPDMIFDDVRRRPEESPYTWVLSVDRRNHKH